MKRSKVLLMLMVMILVIPTFCRAAETRLTAKPSLADPAGAYVYTDGPEGVRKWPVPQLETWLRDYLAALDHTHSYLDLTNLPPTVELCAGCVPTNIGGSYTAVPMLDPSTGDLAARQSVHVISGSAGQEIEVSGLSGVYVNNTSGDITWRLTGAPEGRHLKFRNAAVRAGVQTIAVSAGQDIDLMGQRSISGTGTMMSGGALGDCAAVYGQDSDHWLAEVCAGEWSLGTGTSGCTTAVDGLGTRQVGTNNSLGAGYMDVWTATASCSGPLAYAKVYQSAAPLTGNTRVCVYTKSGATPAQGGTLIGCSASIAMGDTIAWVPADSSATLSGNVTQGMEYWVGLINSGSVSTGVGTSAGHYFAACPTCFASPAENLNTLSWGSESNAPFSVYVTIGED